MATRLETKIVLLGINLLTLVAEDYPDLIDKSSYDYSTPKLNKLYTEQGQRFYELQFMLIYIHVFKY